MKKEKVREIWVSGFLPTTKEFIITVHDDDEDDDEDDAEERIQIENLTEDVFLS